MCNISHFYSIYSLGYLVFSKKTQFTVRFLIKTSYKQVVTSKKKKPTAVFYQCQLN